MKKWLLIPLVIVIAVYLLTQFYRSNDGINQSAISNRQRQEISTAFKASEGMDLFWYQTDGMGAYYLTTVNDCIVFYNLRTWNRYANVEYEYGHGGFTNDEFIPERVRLCQFTLLDATFSPAFKNQLYVYKDSEVLWLTKAWMRDWISDEDVQKVKEAYDIFIQHLIDMGEDEYLKREKKLRTKLLSIWGYDPTYDSFMEKTTSTEYRTFLGYIDEQSEN